MKKTIEYFFNTKTFEKLFAEELLAGDESEVYRLRRKMTEVRQNNERVYVCGKCFSPVFIAFNTDRKGYLKHYSDQEYDCPWYTGQTKHPNAVAALQFQGRQESPLHKALKETVGALLEADERCRLLSIEKIVKGELTEGRRVPDVFASFDTKRISFEVQLATTQMPTLVGKENFYKNNNIYIIWIFWDFESVIERTSSKDTFYANKENAFSLDREAIEEGKRRKRLVLRAHWRVPSIENGQVISGRWVSELIELSDLKWDQNEFKPFYFDLPSEKLRLKEKIKADQARRETERREAQLREFESRWYSRRALTGHAALTIEENLLEPIWRQLNEGYSSNLTSDDWFNFGKVLDRLYSLRDGRVTGSKQNLPAAINTVLERMPDYTGFIVDIASAYGRSDVLARPSIQEKIKRNLARRLSLSSFAFRCERLVRFLLPQYCRITIHKIN